MAIKNLILLTLLDQPVEMAEPVSEWPEADCAEDNLLFAMYLAKIRQRASFQSLLSDTEVEAVPLSQWCLFIGLSEDPDFGLSLFDTLKAQFATEPRVWADLAVLQAANGYAVQAARSLAVHACLEGKVAPVPAFPIMEEVGDRPRGSMRILYGDASSFSGV